MIQEKWTMSPKLVGSVCMFICSVCPVDLFPRPVRLFLEIQAKRPDRLVTNQSELVLEMLCIFRQCPKTLLRDFFHDLLEYTEENTETEGEYLRHAQSTKKLYNFYEDLHDFLHTSLVWGIRINENNSFELVC